MDNKHLYLSDGVDINDYKYFSNPYKFGISKTKVTFRDHDTGEVIWEGRNKVILPGAEFLAMHLFYLPTYTHITPSYNTALDLDNTISMNPPDEPNRVFLWCVGTDGCGRENSQVYEVDYRKWIMPANLVPFQYVKISKDLNSSMRNLYYGKQTASSNWNHPNYYAYYFKTFDGNPQLIRQWTDGIAIDNTVYDQVSTTPVETYVNIQMSITKNDCRDYFRYTTGINDARINTMSICTAWARSATDSTNGSTYTYYQDIRPVTKLNFPNEPLIDLNKGIDITYQIYF